MSNFAAKMHNAIRGTKRSALWFFASCMIAVVASTTLAHAAFNKQLNYQGKLTNASNVAVANGTYNMEFKLYTVSSGGVAVWTETRTGADKVQVTNGLFSVLLGEVNSLSGVDFNQTLYLGVNIGGTGSPSWDGEMTPRKKLGAVPAAIEAENLGGASASQYLRSDIAAASSVTDNTNAAFTIAQLGTGNIFDVFDGATKVLTVLDGGNVGIGDTTPLALFTVGNGDKFQVDGSGNATLQNQGELRLGDADGSNYVGLKAPGTIAANFTWTLPSSDSAGCLQSDGSGNISISSCGGSGSSALSSITAATGTNTINNGNFAQEWEWNGLGAATGFKLSSVSTAAASNLQKLFEIDLSGANAFASQTTYGMYVANTHTGSSATNVGGYFSASGGTNNYGLLVANGNVGIGTVTPAHKLQVEDGAIGLSGTGNEGVSFTTSNAFGLNYLDVTAQTPGNGIAATYHPNTSGVGLPYAFQFSTSDGNESSLLFVGNRSTASHVIAVSNDATDGNPWDLVFRVTPDNTDWGGSGYDSFTIKAGAPTNSLYVDSDGKVGVGTTPIASLDVISNLSEPSAAFSVDTANPWSLTSSRLASFKSAGSEMLAIRPDGAILSGPNTASEFMPSPGYTLASTRDVVAGDEDFNGIGLRVDGNVGSFDNYVQFGTSGSTSTGWHTYQTANMPSGNAVSFNLDTADIYGGELTLESTLSGQSSKFDFLTKGDALTFTGTVNATDRWQFDPSVANGGSAVAYLFDTATNLTTSGAKIASFKNSGAEKFYIDKDGNTVASGTVTGTNISGTNTGDVTLAGENYLSLAGQVITANAVNLSNTNVTGTLAAARFGALTGDVTSVGGTYATTIANGAVTYAKMQNGSATSVLGRSANSSGVLADIAASADNQVLYRSSGALTFGTLPNAALTNSSITVATGTSGTDFNVSGSPVSLGGTLTLNIPNAGATSSTRGLVSTGSQTFYGLKTFNDGLTSTGGISTIGYNTFNNTSFLASGVSYTVNGSTASVSNVATIMNQLGSGVTLTNNSAAALSGTSFAPIARTAPTAGTFGSVVGINAKGPVITTGVGAVTNGAAIYAEGGSGATNNYAVWVGSGNSKFGGQVVIGGTTYAGSSSLSINNTDGNSHAFSVEESASSYWAFVGKNTSTNNEVDFGGGTATGRALSVRAGGTDGSLVVLTGGNVGVGDASPASLFTVGSGDLFQVNSSGAIAAATGITTTGNVTLSTAPTTSAGGYDLLTRNTSTGVIEKVASNTYQTALNGTGYVKMSGTTPSYISAIPNADLANSSISVALGTSGTDANISGSPVSLGGTLTLNLPTASATNRGLLSSTDWSTFNNKQNALTFGSQYQIPYTNATTNGFNYSSAFTWNDSTKLLSLNAGASGAGEFIYTGSSTTAGLQIQSSDINTNAFLRMDDLASSGYMSFGGTASVDFLPTITFKPGTTYPYGLMLVQSTDTGSQPAFTVDSRLASGPLTTQPIFGVQSYGGTPALQVNADSTTLFNAAVLPRTSDGAALGSATKMWSDLFLASGGVVNFNNGDVTLTHTADMVTLTGGNLSVSNLATGGTAPTTTGTTRMVITDSNGLLSFASAPVPTGTNTGDVTLAAVGSSPNANGASLSGQVLTLQPANGSNPGVITAGTQTIGGAKTFTSPIAQSPGAAANLSNYLLTNQSNAANTTTLNPGILVYNDGHPWGVDLGYNNSRYRTRVFASDIGDVALSYVTGTNPTGQSNFTDALVVRGDSGGAGFVGINVLSPSSRFDVLNNVTGLAVNTKVANFSNSSSTFNTTSGALTSYTGYFSSTSTRSAGTNALTNVGLYATASGAQNNYAAIFDQGNVGIGTTTPAYALTVNPAASGLTSGELHVADFTGSAWPSADSSATFISTEQSFVIGNNIHYSGRIDGSESAVYNNNTGITDIANGAENRVQTVNTGTLSIARGTSSNVDMVAAGTISNASAFYSTITKSAGTITNSYGIYLDSQAGTNKWGVYQNDSTASNYFAGKVGIGVSSPSSTAALHVVAGTNKGVLVGSGSGGSGYPSWLGTNGIWADGGIEGKSFIVSTNGLGFNWGTSSAEIYGSGSSDATDYLKFMTNSLDRMTIDGNGNVGIGTTTPSDLLTVDTGASKRTLIGDIGLAGFGGTLAIGNGGMRYASGSYTSLLDVTDLGTISIGDTAVDLNGTLVQVSDMLGNISLNATNGFFFTGGNMNVSALDTDNTAPTTTGTTKMVITDANGQLSFTTIPTGGATALSAIVAATTTNTINNAAYAQEWQWNSLTTGTGMKLSSTSVSSGTLLNLTVNSTAAASDSQKVLNISTSGTNSTTGMTTYGAYVSNSHAGTSATNIAMYLSATGGAANRALIIPSGGGRVGIGTTSPTYLMDVVENSSGFAPSINIANADTGTVSYAQIAFSGSGKTFGIGVGNSTETLNSVANKFFVFDYTTNAMRFVIDSNGSVGIGDTTPNSLFTVGINDAFQINSSGQVTNGSITSTFGSINIGANTFTTTGTVFGNTLDRSTAGALLIGSTATSTSICNSTACDTIQLGTNTDADTITIGDTSNLDAITVNGTLTNTNGSGSNSVINLSSTGDFIIQDNGAAFVTFNDSGNVGIGVAPTYKFDVLNAATAQTATNRVANFSNAGATFNTTAGALSSYAGYFSATSTRSTGSNALTNIGLYATASGAQNNYAAIFDQGNVGIGTTTPTNKFQIYSATNSADLLRVTDALDITTNANTYGVTIMGKNTYLSANYPVLAIGDTSQATAFGIALEAKNGVYNIPTIQLGFSGSGGALDMWNYRSWQPDGTYGMQFTTKGSGGSAINRFSISGNVDTSYVAFQNSNVGIGTATPGAKLEINDSVDTGGGFFKPLRIYNPTLATGQTVQLAFGAANSGYNQAEINFNYIGGTGSTSNTLSFGLYGAPGVLTIQGTNRIGIGNSSPSYTLHVGDGSVAGIIARFQNSTGTCDINPTTTSLSCSSDINLKKNITELDNMDMPYELKTDLTTQEDTILDKVLAITPVTYNWNSENDTDPKHVGFIAQEVEQVFPDLVSTDGQGRKSLNYIGLVPYTIKAVQEMNVRIAALPEFEDQTMAQKVADFLRGIAERGEAVISSIKTQRVHTEELCVGTEGDEVCVTKDQLQNLLNNTSASAGGTPTPTPDQGTDTGTTGDSTTTDDTGTTETVTDTTSTDTTSTDTSSTPAADAGSSSDTPSI